jgi:hypothetical protein
MKRCLLFWIASCLLPAALFAQTQTNVSATVKDPLGIPYANGTYSIQLIPTGNNPTVNGAAIGGAFNGSTDANGRFNVSLWPNASISPGGTTWQFTVCVSPGVQPPLGIGGACTPPTAVTITVASQSLSATLSAVAPQLTNIALGGVSSLSAGTPLTVTPNPITGTGTIACPTCSFLSPNTPGIPSQNGPGMIYASNYGVKADAKQNCFAVITSGSNQVTINSSFGTQFSLADQGAMFEGTNYGCQAGGSGGTLEISGFICANGGFVNATTVNICTTATGSTPANATGNCTGNEATSISCPANWGLHDDTAAWNAAFAADTTICGHLIGPAGRSIITGVIQSSVNWCSLIGNGITSIAQAFRVSGEGASVTVLVPWNTFNGATGGPGGNGCSGNGFNACLFAIPLTASPVSIGYDNFGIDGGGIGTATNVNGKNILYMPGPGYYRDITIGNWGFLNSNFSAYNFGGGSGDLVNGYNLYSYFGGSRCFTSGSGVSLFGMDCFNTQGSIVNGTSNSPPNPTTCFGCNIIADASSANGGAITVVGGATPGFFVDKGSYIVNQGLGPVIQCGGFCNFDHTNLSGQSAAGAVALALNDLTGHAGTVHANNTVFSNPAQVAISASVAGAVLFDECGNTLAGTMTATNISYTACQNGPSIGNVPTISGTGACATHGSQTPATTGGWSGSFTCTGATGTATITITFAYSAPNSIWNCNLNDETTAQTWRQTSHTSTSCTWTSTTNIATNDVITWNASPQ